MTDQSKRHRVWKVAERPDDTPTITERMVLAESGNKFYKAEIAKLRASTADFVYAMSEPTP